MSPRALSVRRARRARRDRLHGFIVTWDVDSRDGALCGRLRRFVFGYTLRKSGKVYRYPGFVDRAGVRYLGQSVVFVTSMRRPEIQRFLRRHGVPHVVTEASIGSSMPS